MALQVSHAWIHPPKRPAQKQPTEGCLSSMWGLYLVALVYQSEGHAPDLTNIWDLAAEPSENEGWQRQRETGTQTETEGERDREIQITN